MNVYFLQIPGYPQVPGNVSENIVKEKPFRELAQLKLHQYLPEGLAFRGLKLECAASPDHRPHQSLVSPLILWHLLFRACQNHHSVGSASRELWWPSNQVADGRDGSGVFQQGTLPGVPAVAAGHLQCRNSYYGTFSAFRILQLLPLSGMRRRLQPDSEWSGQHERQEGKQSAQAVK